MKPEKTNLVRIGYNKETLKNHRFLGHRKFIEFSSENRYFATFKIMGLDENEIGKIISYVERLEPPEDRKIYIKDCNVYVTDFFEAESFESMYPTIVEAAREGVVPKRVDHSVLSVEIGLCLMEEDVDFSVRRVLI